MQNCAENCSVPSRGKRNLGFIREKLSAKLLPFINVGCNNFFLRLELLMTILDESVEIINNLMDSYGATLQQRTAWLVIRKILKEAQKQSTASTNRQSESCQHRFKVGPFSVECVNCGIEYPTTIVG